MPVAVLLLPFLLFLIAYAAYGAFVLFHLMRFGVAGPGLSAVMGICVGGTLALVAACAIALAGVQWDAKMSLEGLPSVIPASFPTSFPTGL